MYLCCAVMECARDGAAVRDKGRGGSGASRGNRRGDRIDSRSRSPIRRPWDEQQIRAHWLWQEEQRIRAGRATDGAAAAAGGAGAAVARAAADVVAKRPRLWTDVAGEADGCGGQPKKEQDGNDAAAGAGRESGAENKEVDGCVGQQQGGDHVAGVGGIPVQEAVAEEASCGRCLSHCDSEAKNNGEKKDTTDMKGKDKKETMEEGTWKKEVKHAMANDAEESSGREDLGSEPDEEWKIRWCFQFLEG